ncbi:hypothetical protein JJL45_02480 [Tamlana sp. s12]|uniref:hypothetical protein n=1 Tax=Tamlana sp. s12 TaxID=1630406 RepID=UPI00080107AC|nr:hypothetical protein [Tamlana sp. s12]OBQ56949.1 hypothetical protein VQ01_00190 [Tamlana sp. s12]QQY82877.1 hypothetical protein JJL45_02480 [Tamlana sp. s12]
MLLHKLKEIETAIDDSKNSSLEQIQTASALKDLLLQIDYKSEHITDLSLDRTLDLLIHLKGDDLSLEEENLVRTIFVTI